MRTLDLSVLMRECGIRHCGTIEIDDDTSSLETDPKNDWLYFALESFKLIAQRKKLASAAFIGSGNGIETIAALKIFEGLEELGVTDVIGDILPQIEQNIRKNVKNLEGKSIRFIQGRDCLPLDQQVDLIYGNLPLVIVDANKLGKSRATTTLTEASAYSHLIEGQDDKLRRYSLLPQLGFLLSAKDKLKDNGTIITLLGGRVPYETIQECFERAGLSYRMIFGGFKRQSDPEFLTEYAEHESKEGIQFCFYDFEEGIRLLRTAGMNSPGIIKEPNDSNLKAILKPAQITASRAYFLSRNGSDIGHLAYSFEASK